MFQLGNSADSRQERQEKHSAEDHWRRIHKNYIVHLEITWNLRAGCINQQMMTEGSTLKDGSN